MYVGMYVGREDPSWLVVQPGTCTGFDWSLSPRAW